MKINKKKKYLISNYRNTIKEQFVLEIIGETEYMGEKAYKCIHNYELSPCKDKFEDKKSCIRENLIGNKQKLYSWFNPKPTYEQLLLF